MACDLLQDRPWSFAQLVKVQERLGKDKFPLVQQTYFPGYQEMVSGDISAKPKFFFKFPSFTNREESPISLVCSKLVMRIPEWEKSKLKAKKASKM